MILAPRTTSCPRSCSIGRAIKPKIRPLPAIFTVEDSLAKKEVLYGTDNVFKQFLIRKGHTADAELEAAFARAAHVITGHYYTSPQEQMYIEPQAMMAEWRDGKCFIVGSMQCPYYVHKAMKPFLGLSAEDVVITQAVTGGGFGGKEEYPSMLAAHVATLAKVAQRSVKMVYDRDEDIAATTKRHPAWTTHRLAIDARGEIIAIDVDCVMDGGAYLTLSPVVSVADLSESARGCAESGRTRIVSPVAFVDAFSSSMFAVPTPPTSHPSRVNGTHGAGVFLPPNVIIAGFGSCAASTTSVQYLNVDEKPVAPLAP